MTEIVITFLASFLIWFMFGGLLVLWIVDGRVKKEQALHAFSAAIVAWIITQIVKSIFPTLRPFNLNGDIPLTFTTPTDSAFPSSHSALVFGLAVTMWLHNKKLGLYFILAAIFVGVGRIFANVHYSLDIIVGAAIGSITSLVIYRLHLFKALKVK